MAVQQRQTDLFWFFFGFLFAAGACQNALQAVVALMAGVLVDGFFRRPQWDHRGPRFSPRAGIIDSELPLQSIGASAREPFDDMQLLGRDVPEHAGSVVGGIDYQRIAFPMPRASPIQVWMFDARCGLPSIGITRAS
jgi:hypothetical protein